MTADCCISCCVCVSCCCLWRPVWVVLFLGSNPNAHNVARLLLFICLFVLESLWCSTKNKADNIDGIKRLIQLVSNRQRTSILSLQPLNTLLHRPRNFLALPIISVVATHLSACQSWWILTIPPSRNIIVNSAVILCTAQHSTDITFWMCLTNLMRSVSIQTL